VIAGIKFEGHPEKDGLFVFRRIAASAPGIRFDRVLAMFQAARPARFVCAAILFGTFAIVAVSQAPFVKTTYGVSPAKETLWALWHDPLSDADIAKVNLDLFAKGNKQAAWELGLAYMQGLGVPVDSSKAEQMFRIGAVDADEKAMVGMFYAHGYFPKDLDAVERWYAAAGRPHDYFEIAEALKAAAQDDPAVAGKYYPKATAIYLKLLKDPSQPEARLAQLELGNFVIDGIYSAGNDAKVRAQNLEWARMIAQELLGQKEFQSAVEYAIGNHGLPKDKTMWLRYCERAVAYNIDNAQHSYVDSINQGEVRDFTGYDAVAYARLNSQKMIADKSLLLAMTSSMNAEQRAGAEATYQALIEERTQYGAYYVDDDPLRDPSAEALAAMDQDDPDVQLREAFNMEKAAVNDEQAYQNALAIYRKVRNERDYGFRFVLGRDALFGTNGVPKDQKVAEYWLKMAAFGGSKPAQQLLDQIGDHAATQ
jgi:TPR repeat protein